MRMEQLRSQKRDLKVTKESLDARDVQLSVGLAEDEDLTAISELLTEKQELEASIQSFKAQCKKEAAQIRSEGVALKNKLENAAPEDEQVWLQSSMLMPLSWFFSEIWVISSS